MPLTPGARLGSYEIVALVGAGGMGEVYRAHDTTLNRDVALKVLPAAVADDPDRLARFEREAYLLASINHPHVVTIHSIEQAGAVRFLTMELVDGRTLDRIIPAAGLPIGNLLAIGVSVADACSAAHEKGIVHRDLKPANVMVDATGRVKVLDFGLAKALGPDGPNATADAETMAAVTHDGRVMGTLPYMSPEQVEGLDVDARSDLFSLGAMLYEMAAGARPFDGRSAAAVMSAILREAPLPLEARRTDLPRDLARVIGRCLEKAPRDRIQTARDVYLELDAVRRAIASDATRARGGVDAPRVSVEMPWIAVMPFTPRGADPELESFAGGVAEDINAGLSRYSYLMVMSQAALQGREGRSDAAAAPRASGARYVLEGSVRQSGTAVRVNVRLVAVDAGTHVWTETYDRDLTDAATFETEDEITDLVVTAVADPYGALLRSMAEPLLAKAPEQLTSYEAVLRFFLFQQRRSPADHLVARAALEQAVARDPYYADAWACLTTVLVDEYRHRFNPRPDSLDRALAAARRAVDASPANQLAYAALAEARYFRRDLDAFRAAAERAIAINPRDSATLGVLGLWFAYAGDWERGRALTDRAIRLNPRGPRISHYVAFFDHYRRGEYPEALDAANRLNMPDYHTTHASLAVVHAELGHAAAARASADELLRLVPTYPEDGQDELERFFFAQPALVGRFVESLRKAGLPMARRE